MSFPSGSGCRAINTPEVILSDPRVKIEFGEQQLVREGGLQPYLLATRTGALIVQVQSAAASLPSPQMTLKWAMETMVSRDCGRTWELQPLPPGENGLNMEGGGIQLRDGTLLALDSFVVPGSQPGMGRGRLYLSQDDWRTQPTAHDITLTLPDVRFEGQFGDDGRPHAAMRLHRRILELPNGDLLTTMYGWFDGDDTPVDYMPSMKRSRVVLLRSRNRGRHWDMVSIVANGKNFPTEGVDEAVLLRLNHGPNAGRLICQMRTGRALHEAISDNEGLTWTPPQPRVYADLDVHRTEKWAAQFRGAKDKHGRPIGDNPVELIGAVVDPDLLELRSGVLVATFGVRVPPRACWPRAEHLWNGSYLAVSLDHGKTWSHVVRMTSGVLTTHYTAIEELPTDNEIYFVHDLGDWRSKLGRSAHGRHIKLKIAAK